jgi:malonyl-CoA O-methyltransferase
MLPMRDSDSGAFPDWPEPRAARRYFSRAASTVDGVDALAREVEGRMFERLPLVKLSPRRILDAGCGLGKGLALLGERYPEAELHGVDAALPVLARARARTHRGGPAAWLARLRGRGAHWTCADFSRLPFAAKSVDMLWSNLAIAWSADPPALFREFHRVLGPGGLLMFSSYGPDTLRELRAAYAEADSLPHVHRFVDMHDLGDMLVEAGFAAPVMDMETVTLTYADFASLARDLRHSGQANAAAGRRRGLSGRTLFARVEEHYARGSGGRREATFEIVYGHAWRGEPRARPGEPAVVHFERRLDHPRRR